MQLSIVIVNYNVKYFLEQCLCSVIKSIDNIDAEIFVVDNNSSDGSKAFFKDKFSNVKFIWNEKNVGFAKANNIAVKEASGEYILFLNPDTIVPEECFKKCISFFKSNADAGAVGIKMFDGSGKFLKESKRSFPSPITSFYKLSGLASLFPYSKTFSKYHLGFLDERQNHEVDVLAGAFMMVPKKIIDSVGSFDEHFFMYGEDIDLSYRIQQAGYNNYYFAESSIIHFKGESTKRGSYNYVRLFYKAMSIFAKKHYGSSKAGFFNLLIQLGIIFRGIVSGLSRFIKWIGMPVIDAGIIFISFWLIKIFWSLYIKKEVNYSPNLINIAFPVFTIIFLVAAYYTGLYDNGYKRKRLNNSTLTAFLILLSGYSLLPEDLRFSRGILVFGCLLAYLLMYLVRQLFIRWRVIDNIDEDDEHRQTIVLGTEQDFVNIKMLMHNARMGERILGRVQVSTASESSAIGSISELHQLLKKYNIKEVIFCEGDLSFKKIIELVTELPKNIRAKFHASNATSIIGSDSKNAAGKFISTDKNYNLSDPINLRNKNFIDVAISFFFIVTFPVHLFHKKPLEFFKNVFLVLTGKKSWISYSSNTKNLPTIRRGILTSTGLPSSLNSLPHESLNASDEWYALDYNIWNDIQLVSRGYKYLHA